MCLNMIKEVLKVDLENVKLFITGLSMGGYGALRLMAKYPKLFLAASGLSSITNLKDLLPFLSREEQRYYSKKFKSEEVINYLIRTGKSCRPSGLIVG